MPLPAPLARLADRLPAMRPRWPTALLVLAVALIAAGVVEVTRAMRSQEETARRVVQDYSRFAAWSYKQHASTLLLGALQELLGAVNHGEGVHESPRIPQAAELAHYLPWNARCACHRPRVGAIPSMFFGFTLGSDTLGLGVNAHADPAQGWEVDRPLPVRAIDPLAEYGPADRKWIVDTLTRQIRNTPTSARFLLVAGEREGRTRFLAYTLMPTLRGDTIVYGAEYSRDAIGQMLADVLYGRTLLPPTLTHARTTADFVQLEVRDALGSPVLHSRGAEAWRLDASDTLPRSLGGLLVRAQVRPAMADALVIGGLPHSRLPFLIALLALAAALSMVAIGQVRRDVELARLRGDFVSSVSHDLRTPLAQMRLYLETLRLGRFRTEEQRSASIAHVERETARLSHLVERVLRFSTQGRVDDEARVEVDAAAEVRQVVEEFGPLAQSRRVQVVADVMDTAGTHGPRLALAPDALRQVLLNLLDNAVKYGPAGQTVHVEVAPVGDEVHIAVSDEGPGVPPAEREQVWAPFRRGSGHKSVAGSGIGLSIVRDVARRHGGRAWVEDATDGSNGNGHGPRGARFVVALPAGAGA
jgi:signal transduction histidine kinase